MESFPFIPNQGFVEFGSLSSLESDATFKIKHCIVQIKKKKKKLEISYLGINTPKSIRSSGMTDIGLYVVSFFFFP